MYSLTDPCVSSVYTARRRSHQNLLSQRVVTPVICQLGDIEKEPRSDTPTNRFAAGLISVNSNRSQAYQTDARIYQADSEPLAHASTQQSRRIAPSTHPRPVIDLLLPQSGLRR